MDISYACNTTRGLCSRLKRGGMGIGHVWLSSMQTTFCGTQVRITACGVHLGPRTANQTLAPVFWSKNRLVNALNLFFVNMT